MQKAVSAVWASTIPMAYLVHFLHTSTAVRRSFSAAQLLCCCPLHRRPAAAPALHAHRYNKDGLSANTTADLQHWVDQESRREHDQAEKALEQLVSGGRE